MTTDDTGNVRRNKRDKLLEGTILIPKDNKEKNDAINKLISFSECLKMEPMRDNDMLKTITTCNDCLQRSHDISQKHLPSA